MSHYDRERLKELERRLLEDERKPKINKKGEIVFLISLLFVVISLIILVN